MQLDVKIKLKIKFRMPNYLIASKPPNTGEPIITAKVTIIPKAAITMPKRLFIQNAFVF